MGAGNDEAFRFHSFTYALPCSSYGLERTKGLPRIKNTTQLDERKRFYFAHSYYISSDDSSLVVATTEYGIEIISVFEKDNIFGVQFHPEKSHEYGMQIFQNFMEICT